MSKKEPFNPALDAPIALTPDQIEEVAGGLRGSMVVNGGLGGLLGGATTGIVPPPPPDRFKSVVVASLTS